MAASILYFLTCASLVASATVRLFEPTFLDACLWLDFSPPMIAYHAPLNEPLCAVMCSLNILCFVYHVNLINKSCALFPIITWSQVANKSSLLPGVCKTAIDTVQHGSQLFESSGTFVVPAGITNLRVVAIGGGGGAYFSNSGGGGSGYVTYQNITVIPGQNFTVTVGAGGLGSNLLSSAATNGSSSSFGNLVIANGGLAAIGRIGRNGGSGGGSGANYTYQSGNGGSCGGNGSMSTDGMSAGMGQGPSFSNWFGNIKYASFSCGAPGLGGLGGNTSVIGGGGGGGLVVNNQSILGGGDITCSGIKGPSSASGYGAGGSASCLLLPNIYGSYTVNGVGYRGGCGASGLVYVEY